MQIPVLLLAAWMIFDGLVGPQLAPKNLATVGTWLEYRGLAVLALLLVGNLFCMACPFMLPRRVGRWIREHWLKDGRPVPRALRGKWLAIALVILFFFAYEYFALWSTPWWTAWVALAYFAIAFAVDMVFQGAAFCKYVCPLGQFNFFGSLFSPLEIKVRKLHVCESCKTKDCITAMSGSRGCELNLFQQRKLGNMDCTFCLDCIHACPRDNIGIITRTPSKELWTDPWRSGIGRFSQRWDLAALVVIFSFGAFLNAFNMIKPVYSLQARLAEIFQTNSRAPGLMLVFILGLLVLPAAVLGLAGLLTQSRLTAQSLGQVVRRYVWSLAAMGFGMWLAHYTFHFLTGALTVVPVVQSFLADIGLFGGQARWDLGPLVPQSWFFPIEAALLYLGAMVSIVVAVQIASNDPARPRDAAGPALTAALPWIAVTLLMLGFGIWIMLQPMEMRGTLMMAPPQ